MSELTKTDLETALDERFDKMAILINSAFQGQKDHFDNLIADLKKDMDQRFEAMERRFDGVENRLQTVEAKLDRALYTELIHLEARLRKVEEKVGLKPQTA